MSEASESFRSIATSENQTPSQDRRSSPQKAPGKENSKPKGRPPVTKKKPPTKGKQAAQSASTSKAASSRGNPQESSAEEPPQRTKTTKATVAQKKSARAPPLESESEGEVSSPEPENRSGRARDRQRREPSAPTPRPVGKVPVGRITGQQTKSQAAAAKQVKPPVGASKRKQKIPLFREMLRLQTTVECQIPRAPFSRVVREIMQRVELHGANMRVTPEALEALRESSESFLVQVFSDSYLITLNRKQVTLAPRDIQLLMFLRGPSGVQRASTR